MHAVGFEPFINEDSKILILGSFPSVKSRENSFYYGNNLNRFWKIIAQINNDEIPKTIDEKKALLIKNKIALYDVVIECDIEGSLDVNIKNPKYAKIDELINGTNIKFIILNGGKAGNIFKNQFEELDKENVFYMPSTSPANTHLDFNEWVGLIRTLQNE